MRFSIVTITWNNAPGLTKTVASVQSQTCHDYDWVVVDGGSSDGSQEWLAAVPSEKLRVISETDRGLYDAMNKGIDATEGEYIIFMNAGDQFFNSDVLGRVDELVEQNSDFGILYGDSYEDDGEKLLRKRATSHRMAWYSMFTHHQAIFYSRKALGRDRYDLSFRLSADYALTAKLLAKGVRARRLPLTICTFERGGVSQSQNNIALANTELGRIHREIIQLPLGLGLVVQSAKIGVNSFRRRFPIIYDVVRGKW